MSEISSAFKLTVLGILWVSLEDSDLIWSLYNRFEPKKKECKCQEIENFRPNMILNVFEFIQFGIQTWLAYAFESLKYYHY